ncbi:MAG TPA: ester cyclase [Thermoplasmata archaeon]|nr:ester cyclase [Thermoplasmata archaeon]
MSVADNIRLLDAGNKALNDHDVERFLSLHLPSIIQRDPQNVEPAKGREAVRAGLEPMIQAFPDFHVVRERAFGEGDWVVEEGQALGTHRGPLETPVGPPIPATNKSIRLPYAFIAKVEGGKFAETHLYFDVAGMMAQLGLGPQPPAGRKP